MNLLHRFGLGLLFANVIAVIAGCALPRDPVKNQIPPQDVVWRNPASDEAVLYLLRSPHDKSVIHPVIGDASVASLPADSYVALRLTPGMYRLTGTKADEPKTRFAVLQIELKPGERRFFYSSTALPNPDRLSGPMGAAAGSTLGLVGQVAAAAAASAFHRQPDDYGTYRWVECADLDARGLASFSKEIIGESN